MSDIYEVQVAVQQKGKFAKATNFVKQKSYQVAVASTLALGAVGAHAEPIEIPAMTDIVTMITGMVAVVASVGMAVLSVYATGRVFKWVKAAF
jgi:hypothetical protein